LKGSKFLFEDTAINCWGTADATVDAKGNANPNPLAAYVDGQKVPTRVRVCKARDIRNSTFRHGRCSLGDRHVLELEGQNAKLVAVDAKLCPDRRFFGMDHPLWRMGDLKPGDFTSAWGAPYGTRQVALPPGAALEIEAVCTDLSVAYVDAPAGGKLRVTVDGVERLVQPADVPFVDIEKKENYIENRKGVRRLPFGMHAVRIETLDAPVAVLGLFTYDSRSNRRMERRLTGLAAPGETIPFTLPFKAAPVVLCSGGLAIKPADIRPTQVTFSGTGVGTYEIVGE
jgi:hypothetical protein